MLNTLVSASTEYELVRNSRLFLYFFRNVNSKLLFRASPNPFSDKEIFIIFDSFRVKFQISLNTRENIT